MVMMPSNLHFPSLTRQLEASYHCNTGGFYAASSYQSNYDMVARDCKSRCVYCDATEKECGGERFSLDHFRPRFIFEAKFNGILVRHPYNLHLSCQKCNVLKSKDWQGCVAEIDGPTYLDGKGYIDRFKQDISDFIVVDSDGRIRSRLPAQEHDGPEAYMIKRLHLNRPTRVYLRKKRCVDQLVRDIEILFSKCSTEVREQWKGGVICADEAMLRIDAVEALRDKFLSIK
jgi:hypothetical protein